MEIHDGEETWIIQSESKCTISLTMVQITIIWGEVGHFPDWLHSSCTLWGVLTPFECDPPWWDKVWAQPPTLLYCFHSYPNTQSDLLPDMCSLQSLWNMPFSFKHSQHTWCLHTSLQEMSTRKIAINSLSKLVDFQRSKPNRFISWCTVCRRVLTVWCHTCLLISAPAWSSHNKHSGWPPNAAMWVGVCANLEVTAFTPQPTWTRRITHSSCDETRAMHIK